MKKFRMLLVIIMSINIFYGCGIKVTDIPFHNKKPGNYYYTEKIVKAIRNGEAVTGKLFEVNLQKEKDIPKEALENMDGFFKSLKTSNFIAKPQDMPEKPQYKIYMVISKEKYVINIYNERYLSIQPWDGIYEMDFIDMGGIHTLYNLHGLCEYYFK